MSWLDADSKTDAGENVGRLIGGWEGYQPVQALAGLLQAEQAGYSQSFSVQSPPGLGTTASESIDRVLHIVQYAVSPSTCLSLFMDRSGFHARLVTQLRRRQSKRSQDFATEALLAIAQIIVFDTEDISGRQGSVTDHGQAETVLKAARQPFGNIIHILRSRQGPTGEAGQDCAKIITLAWLRDSLNAAFVARSYTPSIPSGRTSSSGESIQVC